MSTYHVTIFLYPEPFAEYLGIISSFVESNLHTAEEVKQQILDYHKKKNITVKDVIVTGPHEVGDRNAKT